jgi:hypothetical protein
VFPCEEVLGNVHYRDAEITRHKDQYKPVHDLRFTNH